MILLAEDDKNFGFVLKRELEAAHSAVDLVSDGVEAVLKFIDVRHDIILLDLRMPRLDGINALRIIKKITPDAPVIVFSGNASHPEMAEARKAGALKCLSKPFNIAQLAEEIKKIKELRDGVSA